MARKQPHRIPVKPGQIRYLLSLVPFRDQEALARKLGTSARYVRWMLSGKKPGYKHQAKILRLYEFHRRRGTRQVIRRIARAKHEFVPIASVIKILQYIFQPTDAQKIPNAIRPWQDKETLYISKERKVRGRFSSWDGFSIVMVQGATDAGTISIRRYRPKGGGQHHLEFSEERREEAEEGYESQTVDELIERWNTLPPAYAKIVSHLPLDEWIDSLAEKVFSEPIFNLWVTRFSEREKAGGFANLRDPADPDTRANMEAVVEQNVESAAMEDGDFQFDLVGMYGFTGWNKKHGKKPPRQ